MPRFSIVTCVSDAYIYERCLLRSIRETRKRHDIEIIPIVNNDNRYSASVALNLGIDTARSDHVIFVHQDVRLLDDWFDLLDDAVGKLDNDWGVLGTAGIHLKYKRNDIGMWGGSVSVDTVAVGSVWDSDESLTAPPYWDGVKDISPIHCVDECCFILNKRRGLRFDTLFTGFHFYGVDICLQARAAGYTVYGCHLPIIHYGRYSASFSGDRKYWIYFRLLHNKWHRRFVDLLGTHMHWSKHELTSYISIGLVDLSGIDIKLRAMGARRIVLTNDKDVGILS
jgi:glycosyltransferase involved in cell wall biosynthesis